jgi:hypothetical protein
MWEISPVTALSMFAACANVLDSSEFFSKIFLPKTPLGYKVYLHERVKHVPGTSHESVGTSER